MPKKRGPKPGKAARLRKVEAPAVPDRWAVPSHLDPEASAAWSHVVGLLAKAGTLDQTDSVLIETYAINVSAIRAANAAICEHGLLTENGVGALVANPAVPVLNSATMRVKAIIADLGLTPMANRRNATTTTGGDHGETQGDDKWGDLIVVG